MDIEKLIEQLNNLEACAYGDHINGEVLGIDCSDFEQIMVDAAEEISKIPTLQAENEKLLAELEAARAALAELTGLAGGSVQTLFGVPLERMRELAQAELEGRIMLRSAGSGKKCGSCVHWHRISETKRGTCDVRQWERNRRGHMEPWRHSFTPAQSYGACRHYIPGEDSANG